jgi:hypothetical protein
MSFGMVWPLGAGDVSGVGRGEEERSPGHLAGLTKATDGRQ